MFKNSLDRPPSPSLLRPDYHPSLCPEVPEELARYTAEMTRCRETGTSILGAGVARRLLLLKAGLMQAFSIPGIYLHQVLRKRVKGFEPSKFTSGMWPGVGRIAVSPTGAVCCVVRTRVNLTCDPMQHCAC